jgi:hypothetical protein
MRLNILQTLTFYVYDEIEIEQRRRKMTWQNNPYVGPTKHPKGFSSGVDRPDEQGCSWPWLKWKFWLEVNTACIPKGVLLGTTYACVNQECPSMQWQKIEHGTLYKQEHNSILFLLYFAAVTATKFGYTWWWTHFSTLYDWWEMFVMVIVWIGHDNILFYTFWLSVHTSIYEQFRLFISWSTSLIRHVSSRSTHHQENPLICLGVHCEFTTLQYKLRHHSM